MEGLECAKCQKSKRRDMDGINQIVNGEKDEIRNNGHLLHLKRAKT